MSEQPRRRRRPQASEAENPLESVHAQPNPATQNSPVVSEHTVPVKTRDESLSASDQNNTSLFSAIAQSIKTSNQTIQTLEEQPSSVLKEDTSNKPKISSDTTANKAPRVSKYPLLEQYKREHGMSGYSVQSKPSPAQDNPSIFSSISQSIKTNNQTIQTLEEQPSSVLKEDPSNTPKIPSDTTVKQAPRVSKFPLLEQHKREHGITRRK